MNTTQIPNEKNPTKREFAIGRNGKSDFEMMTELLNRVSNEILFPDITNIEVIYDSDLLQLIVTYLDYVAPSNTADLSFNSRIQMEYDWEHKVFIVKVFINNGLVSRFEGTLAAAVEELVNKGQYEYKSLPIYTYGKWIADKLWELYGFKVLWF